MYTESYLKGKEYSVQAMSFNRQHKILVVTEKFKSEDHCIEIGHCLPANLDNNISKSIEMYVVSILEALGIDNSASHTEIILTEKGPVVVETHARAGGDNIPILLQNSKGINLYEMIAKCTLRINPFENFITVPGASKYTAI
ncbi:hypothetical protein TXYLGN1_19360 [Tepidimicrobium xylanilyticum]|uniref:ATP-grasp domain-containing protein n=2 Tax=Tepidimicrobium xylanilyticum TaxID=1123352 RepID=A0A1H3EE31_9FIRM|nr:hypothetical protein EN5CB1_14230 [Tepidimicrobium xylanilyticum]SDX76966.1 ATP-grasp domain-containing protein [Tepidimicrobium xylanilyticum]